MKCGFNTCILHELQTTSCLLSLSSARRIIERHCSGFHCSAWNFPSPCVCDLCLNFPSPPTGSTVAQIPLGAPAAKAAALPAVVKCQQCEREHNEIVERFSSPGVLPQWDAETPDAEMLQPWLGGTRNWNKSFPQVFAKLVILGFKYLAVLHFLRF